MRRDFNGTVSHRSLLCYDGSDPAKAAIAAAGRIAAGPALVVSVWEPVPPLDGAHPLKAYLSVLGPSAAQLDGAAEDEARQTAAEGAEVARAAGLEAQPRAERQRDSVASTLIALANEEDVDVIVVGARGTRPLGSKFLGSTSNALVQEAGRPVLVVPPPE